jgi:hypothetical protein
MSHPKQASKRKRHKKAIPVLGAAGLSLSLAGGVTPAVADMPAQPAAVAHEVTLADEEISDVSLATFYVFDKEHAGTPQARVRLAMAGGAGCAGCSGCGGCWTGTYYEGSVFGSEGGAKPPHRPAKAVRKDAHVHKRTPAPKNP